MLDVLSLSFLLPFLVLVLSRLDMLFSKFDELQLSGNGSAMGGSDSGMESTTFEVSVLSYFYIAL